MLGVIKYHQVNHNLFDDSRLHPEVQNQLETLHYLVEHNLPVEKDMLFRLVPELFRYEINKLGVKEKLMYKEQRKGFLRADGNICAIDTIDNRMMLESETTEIINKMMQMEHYLLDQSVDLFHLYKENICKYLAENNYRSFADYFMQLEEMDDANRLDWEKAFISEVYQLRGIKEDLVAFK